MRTKTIQKQCERKEREKFERQFKNLSDGVRAICAAHAHAHAHAHARAYALIRGGELKTYRAKNKEKMDHFLSAFISS